MIEAVADHVLIIRPEPASMTHGKIFLPNVARKPYAYGIVWRVGPKVTHVKPGEIVFFDSQACRDVPIADDEKTCFTVVVEDAIYLRLDPFTVIRLAPRSDTVMITNDDHDTGNENIALTGGIWDMDNRSQAPNPFQWNTLVEERVEKQKDIGSAKRKDGAEPLALHEIKIGDEDRFVTRIGELDRVLGGGIVAGSVVLIGGDPGIGKSTLVLQMLRQVSELRGKALYVSGEESPAQIKMRAQRLGVKAENLFVLAETSLDEIIRAADELQLQVIVVDSVQTVFTSELPSAPGSVGQVREVSGRLMLHAKRTGRARGVHQDREISVVRSGWGSGWGRVHAFRAGQHG